MRELQGAVRPFAIPAAILAGAAIGNLVGPPMPESLQGLWVLGPYALLATAVALAWVFNRGRAFVIAASLLGAFAAQQLYAGKVVHTALVVLVPERERGGDEAATGHVDPALQHPQVEQRVLPGITRGVRGPAHRPVVEVHAADRAQARHLHGRAMLPADRVEPFTEPVGRLVEGHGRLRRERFP